MSDALKPSEVLAKAADLIEPEGAWTQAMRARDALGHRVEARDASAVCFCAIGAVERFSVNENPYSAPELRWVRRAVRAQEVGFWNDRPSRRQGQVVAALRKASELAKAEGQ